ncbi:MAG: DUF3078 domain-containing protein [Muricauda sp.]|uniref:Conserved hypothetical periplasmic protein n=1 Tax=Flagellimonas lutaonensis TaxID=516051 RepID=A0A0D5YTJ1_9FLAO|nr:MULTISPECIES: DUF3078 domain-containing protein [Allomuricauda]AKA35186.1 Conserved hypothetical periplasmic protein [Allomuricauda lutaonensis]MAU26727.1 DUF3078 domain-containing protein [Allomuricauda sp.]MBC30521.1 DUF3078 domain-containing protein [Allomuricauda sp.]|tara:strand:+ start:14699 stop:15754 length:1056 start_codon:yes stop_codon:yes gene_type:complete
MNTKKIFFLFFLIAFSVCGQDSISQQTVDSLDWDVTVIRMPQKQINIIPRGVRRISPRISFNKVKALKEKPKKFVPPLFWKQENLLNINLNEVAFVNWNAGGNNSVTALGNLTFTRNYKYRYITWDNELRFRYGINVQEGRSVQKTDDLIRLSSTFGFRRDTLTNWFYSVKTKFNTQFTNGYKYPDTSTPISRFMAPGYFFFGAGTTYAPDTKKFNLYISPLTYKATFVLDEDLSNQGAFGVEKGKNVFAELGFLITNTWEDEIFKNIFINHRLNLYTDYLKSFGNVDVDWELNFKLKVNEYINADIGTHIIYDDDIKFDEQLADDGTVVDPGVPKVQFKQLLGIGLSFAF